MKISVEVYSQDIDASLNAFKDAFNSGAVRVFLRSSHDYDTGKFEYLNLRYDADHNNEALARLEKGPFQEDTSF
tara:strand:+ start:4912 stop:5133 length:222 start_codon:yes stop_codon:yes gene_type:complete